MAQPTVADIINPDSTWKGFVDKPLEATIIRAFDQRDCSTGPYRFFEVGDTADAHEVLRLKVWNIDKFAAAGQLEESTRVRLAYFKIADWQGQREISINHLPYRQQITVLGDGAAEAAPGGAGAEASADVGAGHDMTLDNALADSSQAQGVRVEMQSENEAPIRVVKIPPIYTSAEKIQEVCKELPYGLLHKVEMNVAGHECVTLEPTQQAVWDLALTDGSQQHLTIRVYNPDRLSDEVSGAIENQRKVRIRAVQYVHQPDADKYELSVNIHPNDTSTIEVVSEDSSSAAPPPAKKAKHAPSAPYLQPLYKENEIIGSPNK